MVRLYKNLIKFALYAEIKIPEAVKKINKLHKRMFAYLCMPLGYLAVYIDKKKANRAAQS
jgi:hypothetical protein